MDVEKLLKALWKMEKILLDRIPKFSHTIFTILGIFNVSSTNSVDLHRSKLLLFGKELMFYFVYFTTFL